MTLYRDVSRENVCFFEAITLSYVTLSHPSVHSGSPVTTHLLWLTVAATSLRHRRHSSTREPRFSEFYTRIRRFLRRITSSCAGMRTTIKNLMVLFLCQQCACHLSLHHLRRAPAPARTRRPPTHMAHAGLILLWWPATPLTKYANNPLALYMPQNAHRARDATSPRCIVPQKRMEESVAHSDVVRVATCTVRILTTFK
jgi:hypothetical protein